MIMQGFINTIIIVVSATVLNVIFTSICAYVLSRKQVLWNGFFSKFIIFTMFFNGGMIPTYLVVTQILHLNNSWWALILPGLISVYNMIIMRTSFSAIPDSLVESAQLDGASHWTILFRIILPLSKAVIAVMILYYAVSHWNAWFNASIYIKDRAKFPVQLILREILIANDTSNMAAGTAASDQVEIGEVIKYATIVTTTVPILIVYPFLQKYFVGGVMIGAVKG
ncbi:MAG: carbohydrate ABC transporter permease, partial [Clostridia bacterium]|nr:carbohydrate ABC transporter permease [Clostridia bacterium]